LKGRGKQRHITREPTKDDPKFTAWDEEDAMIKAWLWNSMKPKICDTCVCTYQCKGDLALQGISLFDKGDLALQGIGLVDESH
jgi:hypothetical protein